MKGVVLGLSHRFVVDLLIGQLVYGFLSSVFRVIFFIIRLQLLVKDIRVMLAGLFLLLELFTRLLHGLLSFFTIGVLRRMALFEPLVQLMSLTRLLGVMAPPGMVPLVLKFEVKMALVRLPLSLQ